MRKIYKCSFIGKNVKLFILLIFSLTISNAFSQNENDTNSFEDTRDFKTYKIVKIGDQIWMAENLNYKPLAGSWCYDGNSNNCEIYGRLYNWTTALKVCPTGWHLPSDNEWTTLTNNLGGLKVAGGKLKLNSNWEKPNKGATNSSGFSAIPGGYRETNKEYEQIGLKGEWWVSTEFDETSTWGRELSTYSNAVSRYYDDKSLAFSVRCLKD